MPQYMVTLAARPAGSLAPFQNHTVKTLASNAQAAIRAAVDRLQGASFELLARVPDEHSSADPAGPSAYRMPDGYPDHSPELGN